MVLTSAKRTSPVGVEEIRANAVRRAATAGGSSSRRCTLGRQEAMDLGADRDTGLAAERNKVGDEVVVPVGTVVVAVHQGGMGEEEVPVAVDGLC